jgi:bifunctional oligoribonuclease and PAP phosphatase NrnA
MDGVVNDTMTTAVPAQRVAALQRIIALVKPAERVVLTTHVNADGDGAGSQAALVHWLTGLGKHVRVVNPTTFPRLFRFLYPDPDVIADAGTAAGDRALREADLIIVVDTAEPGRIGRVAKWTKDRAVAVMDHHLEGDTLIDGERLMDATACAAGELVFDLMLVAEVPRPWARPIAEGVYTALVTDTGSFRFSNTTPRAHAIAGDLIAQGVDPEAMYRQIFATVPLRRIELLQHALERLVVDPEFGITSISVERDIMERIDGTSEDLEGIIDHARSIEGTEVAVMFRETSDGATKVSLRSAGEIDVNAIAREFGGGGHRKASGALIPDALSNARPRILEAVRNALLAAGLAFRARRENT